jgi:hypothetical protein
MAVKIGPTAAVAACVVVVSAIAWMNLSFVEVKRAEGIDSAILVQYSPLWGTKYVEKESGDVLARADGRNTWFIKSMSRSGDEWVIVFRKAQVVDARQSDGDRTQGGGTNELHGTK